VADLERLQEGLADRYRLEPELGRGGMASLYSSTVIGLEHSVRDVKSNVNSGLHAPAVRLWIRRMPFVDGESPSERLRPELQLPTDDAVPIAREVAGTSDGRLPEGSRPHDV
jgi:hypothetical protein